MRDLARVILTLLTAIGVVLFWRGVWELSERYIDGTTSLLLGLLLVAVVAALERKRLFGQLSE